jgi:integrase
MDTSPLPTGPSKNQRAGIPLLFTARWLASLKPKATPYKFAETADADDPTQPAKRGMGRFIVRVQPDGRKEFFFRYRMNGGDRLIAIGRWSDSGKDGIKLAAARARFRELEAERVRVGDVKVHRASERAAEQTRRLAQAREDERIARQGTFQQLLEAYVQHLRDSGKVSAGEVSGVFERHLYRPKLPLLARRANEVEPEELAEVLAVLVRRGVKRQTNVLRSYLRAAFAFGASQDLSPSRVASAGTRFYLKSNPVALIPVERQFSVPGERHLSADELRLFWQATEAVGPVTRAFLRFNLAIAGQRATQLLRATWADFDLDAGQLLLRDPKGRGASRDHLLPLTAFAVNQLQPMIELNGKAAMPFTNDGETSLRLETISTAVAAVSSKLVETHGIVPFRFGDLRRTSETMLASLGVDRETRAQLLSHGRQGVQAKHYDRHHYLPEKRAAMEKWGAHLLDISSQ